MANWAQVGYRIEGKQKDPRRHMSFSENLTRVKESHLMSFLPRIGKVTSHGLWEKTSRITISEVSSKVVK